MGQGVDILLPVFGIVALGFAATRIGWFDDAARRGLSHFVFTFAIPVLLFRTLAGTQLPAVLPWTYLLSYYGGVASVFLISMMISRVFFRQPLEGQAVHGLGGAFSNTVLLGTPLILTAFGEAATLPLFLLIAFHGVLILPIGTVLIETGLSAQSRLDGDGVRVGEIARQAALGVVTNPIILGLAAGLAANLAGWAPTGAVDRMAALLGQAALPCALFAMGASLARFRLAGAVPQALAIVAVKLVVHPAIVWLLAVRLFALDPLWAGVAVVLAGMPTGVNIYLYAQRYEIEIAPIATAILIGTALSVLTIGVLTAVMVPA